MPHYVPSAIEPRWQQYWLKNKIFRTSDESGGKPKYYILDMFPYPSGSGLHVGHPEGYTATDILARYKRMRGFQVLHPMGWDAFGLPAEQHAIATGEHPSINTQNNVNTFRRQIQSLGFSYDWDREVDTTDPHYVKWTQWIFLLIYDTWYDADAKKGRPISELPIPAEVKAQGAAAVLKYQDSHRLAMESEVPVNWCEALGTVLSNEEVIDGKSERGSHPVVRRPLKQWLLRITEYAERLIDDLEPLDWSPAIKQMQRNWIGKSEGATVRFDLASRERQRPESSIEVFTTRPDTLFGATYMVLSPEHALVESITTPEQKAAVQEYRETAARKSDFERTEMAKTKTGVFTGAYAINPVNGKQIPIWIADYVLASYGTGAIMAVPAHDERDFEFAKKFDLEITLVVQPEMDTGAQETFLKHFNSSTDFQIFLWIPKSHPDLKVYEGSAQRWLEKNRPSDFEFMTKVEVFENGSVILSKGSQGYLSDAHFSSPILVGHYSLNSAFTFHGLNCNSGMLNDMTTEEAKRKITAWLVVEGKGEAKVNYKLRDWLFSRQRYWGEPFPILHEVNDKGERTGVTRALTEKDLPVTLPEMADFKPTGSPDGPLAKATDWLTVKLDGKTYRRETNTMPQWAGSCWYYLRYIDAKNPTAFAEAGKLNHWLPVDLYVGGAEHAVLHLLYSRFWHKILYDRGYVGCKEPFQKLVNQGMILGENNEKMSKARGNVVNPDDVVKEYGADSLRLYEMFMGPLEAVKPWNTKGVEGVYRFLGRAWRLFIDDGDEMRLKSNVENVEPDRDTLRILHRTIKKVGEDTEAMQFNTAISTMMEFVNHMTKLDVRPRSVLEPFVLLLAPYAPHVAEELWAALGHPETLAYEKFPTYDPELVKDDEIEVPVQVNGKLKVKLKLPADATNSAMEAAAMADAKVKEALGGKPPKKVIVVPKKLVNIVA